MQFSKAAQRRGALTPRHRVPGLVFLDGDGTFGAHHLCRRCLYLMIYIVNVLGYHLALAVFTALKHVHGNLVAAPMSFAFAVIDQHPHVP